MSIKKTNLFNALAKFIEAMRLYLFTGLKNQYGEAWERKYCESLLHTQKEHWGKKLQEGIDPIQLIDYGNLKSFALNNRSFFEKDFGRQRNNLPTIFNQISEARNMLNHYEEFDNDKAEKAYLHMIELAKILEMGELEISLRKLKLDSFDSALSMALEAPPKSKQNISAQPVSRKKNLKKSDAIGIINDAIDDNLLSHGNTVFSNINKTDPCWWLNIPPSKFEGSLNILLAENEELIWINLPKDTCNPPESFFDVRKDNGKIDLRIGIEGNDYLKDYLNDNSFNFKPYIRRRFRI